MNPLGRFITLSALLVSCVSADLPVQNWLNHRFRRELVDLHKGEFCVDVSTFGEIQYNPVPREKCDSTFSKQCEEKTENVCDDVTEIECEIVPYTECEMIMENAAYRSYKMVKKEYTRKVCNEGMKTVQHTKMMPECKNVTKQNCVTKWETDEDGNQVWAGNEACEPVTWRECELVPREVDFKVPKIECSEGDVVPYTDCEDEEKETMTTNMLCEVKHTTNCVPKTSNKCKSITYTECQELPEETCETVDTQVPFQEKEHKKKCLLPDNGSLPAAARKEPEPAAKPALVAEESRRDSLAAPQVTPQPSYGAPRGGRQQQFRSQPQQQFRSGRNFRGQASVPQFNQQKFAQRSGQQAFRNQRNQFQQGQFVRHGRN